MAGAPGDASPALAVAGGELGGGGDADRDRSGVGFAHGGHDLADVALTGGLHLRDDIRVLPGDVLLLAGVGGDVVEFAVVVE